MSVVSVSRNPDLKEGIERKREVSRAQPEQCQQMEESPLFPGPSPAIAPVIEDQPQPGSTSVCLDSSEKIT